MGKSKMFNGFLWILQDMVYDSDTRRKETVVNAAMKMLSEKAKLESSSECGVQIYLVMSRINIPLLNL